MLSILKIKDIIIEIALIKAFLVNLQSIISLVMKIKKSLFPAKLILFGEYAVMENSKGLCIPHDFYKGTLKFKSQSEIFSNLSNKILMRYADFLKKLQQHDDFTVDLDLYSICTDVEKGMYFHSNIPQGYGIGSSGALVAAIYENYVRNRISPKNAFKKNSILILRKTFSIMESYFHKKSSGIDPLICYLNLPLLIHSTNDISTVNIPKIKNGVGAIFLINSGVSSSTSSMIEVFFHKLRNRGFRKTLRKEFMKYNDICIEAFLKENFKPLLKNVKSLSTWVLQNLRPMIPPFLCDLWYEGIHTNTYYLKLCGSGGGGFLLGFAGDYEIAREKLKDYSPEVIFRF